MMTRGDLARGLIRGIAMRTVGTLAALGLVLILLQMVWAPADDSPWPFHLWPLLLGVGILAIAGMVGLVDGPSSVRVTVALGMLSAVLFLAAVLLPAPGSSGTNVYLAVVGTGVAMLAVLSGWRAAGDERRPG
jgi:peptidoglycan/LPS O-acetylase OafA/YrhL